VLALLIVVGFLGKIRYKGEGFKPGEWKNEN